MEKSTEETIPTVKTEGSFTHQKIEEMVLWGKPIIEGSALVEEREIGPKDVERVRTLLETVAPITKDNFRVHAHLQLTGKFARKIGETLNLNGDELEIRGLLHDIGRFVTHRYFRNDLVGGSLLKELGIRADFLAKMPSLWRYIRPPYYESVEDLTLQQRIVDIADFCGKRKDDGGIFTFDEVMGYHRASRSRYEDLTGLKAIWPTEKYAFRHMLPDEQSGDEGIIERSAKIYEELRKWLAKQGVDVEKIRLEILEEEAQSKIQAVVFDVGRVMIPNPDPRTKEDFAAAFAISEESVEQAWEILVPKLQTGQLSEEEFWQAFSEKINKPPPAGYQELWTKSLVTQIEPKVKAIIERLKERGLRLAVLTNTIPPHQKALKEAGAYDNFPLVVTSPEIRTKKDSTVAFYIVALRLGLPPQSCVFIDDQEEAVSLAQEAKMQGIRFENPEQLERELRSKNLI